MSGICSFPSCGRPLYCRGLCDSHRKQLSAGLSLRPIQTTKVPHLVGQRFGRLVVVERRASRLQKAMWLCRCDCGGSTIVSTGSLRGGNTSSCSCSWGERHNTPKNDPVYRAWLNMKQRCLNPRRREWPNYGGRGIRIHERWLRRFSAFRDDMGDRPDGTSLDRIDVNGNYEPGNCRWATGAQQAQNTRVNTLTRKIVEQIRREYVRGKVRQVDLAAKFGATQAAISAIVRGASWRDA